MLEISEKPNALLELLNHIQEHSIVAGKIY